jgi:hypothetical protein
MLNTNESEEIEIYPYSRLFAETVQKTVSVVIAISLFVYLALYLANLSLWLESIDWEDAIYTTIYEAIEGPSSGAATSGDANGINSGDGVVSCIFGGPNSCVGNLGINNEILNSNNN